ELLRPFGPILDFSLPQTNNHDGYALAKLQSNDAADSAVRALDGCSLRGCTVRVRRAEYWSRFVDDRTTRKFVDSPR
ncbi:hypothetical protein PMAYCL1PPCAC_01538, partial [Pristionchus mayeri]